MKGFSRGRVRLVFLIWRNSILKNEEKYTIFCTRKLAAEIRTVIWEDNFNQNECLVSVRPTKIWDIIIRYTENWHSCRIYYLRWLSKRLSLPNRTWNRSSFCRATFLYAYINNYDSALSLQTIFYSLRLRDRVSYSEKSSYSSLHFSRIYSYWRRLTSFWNFLFLGRVYRIIGTIYCSGANPEQSRK